jgi:hypothetical protein
MIAGFHGLDVDQERIAELTSADSANSLGTYPSDMMRAMAKLGFSSDSLFWTNENFESEALPRIRRALVESGPVYVSYKAGVFGEMGHGCVIIGYNDRREEFILHNPWGRVFEDGYASLRTQAHGAVLVNPPQAAPAADELSMQQLETAVPRFPGGLAELLQKLQSGGIAHELIWCSRADARDDRRFARDTARDHGRQILELAFERNPAVLIPENEDDETVAFLVVTRPPEGGARFLVRRIDRSGWSQPDLWTLGSLTRGWTTRLTVESGEAIWELPLIELHPTR